MKATRINTMYRTAFIAAGVATLITLSGHGTAAAQDRLPSLTADPRLRGPVPIPVSERDIPTVVALPWIQAISGTTPLEGVAFSPTGDVLLCDVGGGRVLRLSADGEPATLFEQPGSGPGGLAVDKSGQVFVAAAGDLSAGMILSLPQHGGEPEVILPQSAGYVPNDLAPDGRGGLYFTDFKGSAFEGTGGVYHLAADMKTITPIVSGLALPNGIALSPDRRTLWVAEHGLNRLIRIQLEGQTGIARLGIDVVYNFIGPKPDTIRTDAEGNVYVALNGQGRVLILSPGGTPIGQILLSGRDEGRNLRSTSFAIRPEDNEVVIVSSDGDGGGGGWVHRARTFGRSLP